MSSNNDTPASVPADEEVVAGDTAPGSSAGASSQEDANSTDTNDVGAHPVITGSWKGWAELENDPVIFSTLLREWGVLNVEVHEVVPLDSLFDYDPESVYGLIFLSQWAAPETENDLAEAPTGLWFANQTSDFSCATVALMNIINNHAAMDLGHVLSDFRGDTRNMTPKGRGLALDGFDHVRDVHNSFATEVDRLNVDWKLKRDVTAAEKERKRKEKAALAKRPRKKRKEVDEDEEDENGLHFVAFVPAGGAVWRMDGLERLPRKLGEVVDGGGWTNVAIPALQAQLEAAEESGSLHYSLLSLVAATDSSSLEADRVKMDRAREDWGPFLAQMVRIHAEKGILKEAMG